MSCKTVIAYHGHCFDGMCSAAALTRFLSRYESIELDFKYRGLDHQSGGSYVPDDVLFGDINAVVDFRYSTSDKLTWWFDHHISGIVGEKEKQHYQSNQNGKKFFDPNYSSCCRLIVDVAQNHFGIEMPELKNLVNWAEIIDGAKFRDVKCAVELKEPALQLMTVIEAHGDDRFLTPRIHQLSEGVLLEQIACDDEVKKLFHPLLDLHQKNCELIRDIAVYKKGVVSFNLAGRGSDRYNKFIPYWIYPDAQYCVAILASNSRTKISVGSNPWSTVTRQHDISKICAQFGGGGHPAVGAITLKPDKLECAKKISQSIVQILSEQNGK